MGFNFESRIVRPASEIQVLPVHVEIKCLIEPLITDIPAELDVVLPNCFREIIRPLERVSGLWQFTFKVIAEVESTRNIYKRHALAASAKSRMNAQIRVSGIGEAVRRRHRHARIRHQCGVLRVQKRPLAFAEKRKAPSFTAVAPMVHV